MQQTVLQAPWQAYFAAQPKRGAWGDYFRGMSLMLWLLLLIIPFWWLSEWSDIYDVRESGRDKLFQYAAFGVALAAHLTLGLGRLTDQTLHFLASTRGRLLTIFCVLTLAVSPASLLPTRSALYAGATLGALLVCHWAWQADYDRFCKVMVITGFVLFAYLYLLLAQHGMGRSSVGGIQRNRFGHAVVAAAICVFFGKGKIKWAGLPLAAVLLLLVSSRSSMLFLGVFLMSYYVLKNGFSKSISMLVFGSLVGVALIALPSIGKRASTAVVDDVMKLHDSQRGLGSGFTGRTERWAEGMKLFAKRPAIGYGFRTRTNDLSVPESRSAHGGYLNLLVDTGLLGFGLIMFAFGLEFFRRYHLITHLRTGQDKYQAMIDSNSSLELNAIVCGMLLAQAAIWVFEPLYLNLGSSLSVLFFLLLMAPYRLPLFPITARNKSRDFDDQLLSSQR